MIKLPEIQVGVASSQNMERPEKSSTSAAKFTFNKHLLRTYYVWNLYLLHVFVFFNNLKFLFGVGCAGSLLPHWLFSQRAGVTLHCIVQASRSGLFCCGAQTRGRQTLVVAARGLNSYGSQALERRRNRYGQRAELLHSMWDPPGSGIQLEPPALVGGFLTTEPSGKPLMS